MEVMDVIEVMEVSGSGPMFVSEERPAYGSAPRSHRDLKIYQRAFDLALEVGAVAKGLPSYEQFASADQMRRSSKSVCAQIAEAWRRRRYKAAFINRMNGAEAEAEAEAEAGETQCWLEFSHAEGHIDLETFERLWNGYESLLGSFVGIIQHADKWIIKQ